MNKCHPVALGVALGALWAFYLVCLAIMASFGWGAEWIAPIASLYIGYSASIIGALIGAAWGLGDGFIAGVLIAVVYNFVAKRTSCCCCDCDK
ncbi:MAG: bacteriophage holin [Patescibacteria group bacterium]